MPYSSRKKSFIISRGADFPKSYKEAIVKGFRIKSRYKGVVVICPRSIPYWMAQKWMGGTQFNSQCFPFTEQGEIDAAKAYEEMNLRISSSIV